MARYHFVVRESNFTHDDPDGVHLPNDDVARERIRKVQRAIQSGQLFQAELAVRESRPLASTLRGNSQTGRVRAGIVHELRVRRDAERRRPSASRRGHGAELVAGLTAGGLRESHQGLPERVGSNCRRGPRRHDAADRLDDVDIAAIPIKKFDGKHWEDAMQQKVPWR